MTIARTYLSTSGVVVGAVHQHVAVQGEGAAPYVDLQAPGHLPTDGVLHLRHVQRLSLDRERHNDASCRSDELKTFIYQVYEIICRLLPKYTVRSWILIGHISNLFLNNRMYANMPVGLKDVKGKWSLWNYVYGNSTNIF